MLALLEWMWWLVALAGFAGDVRDLAHPDFDTREAAHARLSRWGLVAYPLLSSGRGSSDPEVAYHCRHLCARWDAAYGEAVGWWLILVPERWVPLEWMWTDRLSIKWLLFIAENIGDPDTRINEGFLRGLKPERWHEYETSPALTCWYSLKEIRGQLRYRATLKDPVWKPPAGWHVIE